jgi:hypothetical protein
VHFHPSVDLNWLAAEWPPDAAVLGPAARGPWPAQLRNCVSVAINVDRSAEGVASVCLDQARIADMAVELFWRAASAPSRCFASTMRRSP